MKTESDNRYAVMRFETIADEERTSTHYHYIKETGRAYSLIFGHDQNSLYVGGYYD